MNSATPFNWSSLIANLADETFGIPPDVTFQIVEDDQIKEVTAHKMIMGMVSPMFKKMFFTTDVGDKNATEIDIKETTFEAFQILIDAIYNTKSIEDSLNGKSVHEIFDVVNLIERYQIPELRKSLEVHLSNYPVTDDTVLEVAVETMQYTSVFQTETEHLFLICAKVLKPKLNDANSIMKYISENINYKEAVAILIAKIYENYEIPCPNCSYKKENCQNGVGVKKDEFREGIVVTNNKVNSSYWNQQDCGTGKVTKVNPLQVIVETINPGITQNGLIGKQFNGGSFVKSAYGIPSCLYSCS